MKNDKKSETVRSKSPRFSRDYKRGETGENSRGKRSSEGEKGPRFSRDYKRGETGENSRGKRSSTRDRGPGMSRGYREKSRDFKRHDRGKDLKDEPILVYGRHPVADIDINYWQVKRIIVQNDLEIQSQLPWKIPATAKIKRVDRKELDILCNDGIHQGIAVELNPGNWPSIGEITDIKAPLILVVDHVQDPRNFGAIIRTAEAAGVAAIIFPSWRGAPLSAVTIKASSGAALRMPLCMVSSIPSALRELKKADYVILGCDSQVGESYRNFEYSKPLCIVVGSEGEGLSQLSKKLCDELLYIPMKGKMPSLNVSVATGIVLFQASEAIFGGEQEL